MAYCKILELANSDKNHKPLLRGPLFIMASSGAPLYALEGISNYRSCVYVCETVGCEPK